MTPAAPAAPAAPVSRRAFARRMGGASLAALAGGGLLAPDEAWAAIEERAARHGIVPGTYVDAQGRPLEAPPNTYVYLAELYIVPYTFAPRFTAFCNGQLLSIAQNTALFSLLGTTYGGDGTATFGLPDLRGRVPIGAGQGPGLQNYDLGQVGGTEQVTLTLPQLPQHQHQVSFPASSDPGTVADPTGAYLAAPASSIPSFVTSGMDGGLAGTTTGPAGAGSVPVEIRQPYLALQYVIALQGLFPSRP